MFNYVNAFFIKQLGVQLLFLQVSPRAGVWFDHSFEWDTANLISHYWNAYDHLTMSTLQKSQEPSF